MSAVTADQMIAASVPRSITPQDVRREMAAVMARLERIEGQLARIETQLAELVERSARNKPTSTR